MRGYPIYSWSYLRRGSDSPTVSSPTSNPKILCPRPEVHAFPRRNERIIGCHKTFESRTLINGPYFELGLLLLLSTRRLLSSRFRLCRRITEAYIFELILHGGTLDRRRLLVRLCLVSFTPHLLLLTGDVEGFPRSSGFTGCLAALVSLLL